MEMLEVSGVIIRTETRPMAEGRDQNIPLNETILQRLENLAQLHRAPQLHPQSQASAILYPQSRHRQLTRGNRGRRNGNITSLV